MYLYGEKKGQRENGLDVEDTMVDPETDRINWYIRFQRLKEEKVGQNVGINNGVVRPSPMKFLWFLGCGPF